MTLLSPRPTYVPVSSYVNGSAERLGRPSAAPGTQTALNKCSHYGIEGEPGTGRGAFSAVAAVSTDCWLEGDVQRAPDQREVTVVTVLVTDTLTATKLFYPPTPYPSPEFRYLDQSPRSWYSTFHNAGKRYIQLNEHMNERTNGWML